MTAVMKRDGARPFVVFGVGGMDFALALGDVLEILRPPGVVPVPLGPPSLLGLARRRGAVLPVISLRRILGLPESASDGGERLLVVRHRGQPAGLMVDRIAGLSSVTDDRIDTATGDTATGEAAQDGIDGALLAGVIRDAAGGSGTLILDAAPVIERQFADLGRVGGSNAQSVHQSAVQPGGATDAGPDSGGAADEERLVLFGVAGQEFALPVEAVREVVPLPDALTRVPRARAHLLGVMTLRDTLLPIVGLRALFGLADDRSGEARGQRVVVLRTVDGLVGLVVDGVREILRISRGRIDPVPPLMAREAEFEDVAGIARVDATRVVPVLSASRMFRHGSALGAGGQEEERTMEEVHEAGRTEAFVAFRLAGAEYGLPVAAVQEVLRRPDAPTPLPNAPDFVRGVMTVRGAVLPLIDQRRLLRLPDDGAGAGAGDRARVVVIGNGDSRAGLLVDRLSGIVHAPLDRIEAAPVVSQAQHRLIRRVASVDDPAAPDGRRMILLMDPGELLDMDQLAVLLADA